MELDDVVSMMRGTKYKIRYRLEHQKRDRQGVATYLGLGTLGAGGQKTELTFSGRPEFGTTSLMLTDMISVEPVAENTKCYMDKKV
jgi:hypothetical protein